MIAKHIQEVKIAPSKHFSFLGIFLILLTPYLRKRLDAENVPNNTY